MTYFVQPKCKLLPTATVFVVSVDCVAWPRESGEIFNIILLIKWKALNRKNQQSKYRVQ